MDKHSSLLRILIDYCLESFITLGPEQIVETIADNASRIEY
jgi:hypothetical protein